MVSDVSCIRSKQLRKYQYLAPTSLSTWHSPPCVDLLPIRGGEQPLQPQAAVVAALIEGAVREGPSAMT